jgi:malonyl-CoA/methylmalonyl-CoA synthetase
LVPEDGAQLDLDSISQSISISLARFKQPQQLIVLPELPRNAMGKVQKKTLRAQFRDLYPALS